MIISTMSDDKSIYLSWRENGEKKWNVAESRPYFFILDSHKEIRFYRPSKYVKREFQYESGDWVSLEGTSLKKVYVDGVIL